MYKVEFLSIAKKSIRQMAKSDYSSYKKVVTLLEQLQDDPRKGTGKPERLKGKNSYKL